MPPFGGALPPSLLGAPPGAGPVAVPQGNPGNSLAAMQKVTTALNMLQEALPALPMGTPLHTSILRSVKELGTHLGSAQQDEAQQIQQLVQMIRQAKQAQATQALSRIGPAGPMAGAPPGAPPGMAPPGAPMLPPPSPAGMTPPAALAA